MAGVVAAASAPWTLPALGAALGGGAAAAGAAGAGAGGVAAGEVLAGGGIAGMGAPMASMFGPSAAGAELVGAFAPGAGATPMFTSLAATPAAGGSSMFGAGQGVSGLSGLLGSDATALSSLGNSATAFQPTDWSKGLKALETAQKYQKLAGGDQEKQPPPMMQRPQAATVDSDLAALYAMIYPYRKRKDY